MKRKTSILISVAFGFVFFLAMLPFQFDRYVPLLHSALSIFLNAVSAVLFSTTLCRFLNKKLLQERRLTVYYLLLLAVAHGVYSVMFWSSWICLGIIAAWLVTIVGLSVKNR